MIAESNFGERALADSFAYNIVADFFLFLPARVAAVHIYTVYVIRIVRIVLIHARVVAAIRLLNSGRHSRVHFTLHHSGFLFEIYLSSSFFLISRARVNKDDDDDDSGDNKKTQKYNTMLLLCCLVGDTRKYIF